MQHQYVDLILVLMTLAAIGGLIWYAYCNQVLEAKRRGYEKGQARFQAMVEDQTDLISRADAEGKRLYVNEAYCRFFNRTRSELIGEKIGSFISEEDRKWFYHLIDGLSPNNPVLEIEHQVIRHDGAKRWYHWASTGIFDSDGKLSEIHGVGRDITERKRAEEALKESEKRLRMFSDAMPALFSYIDKDQRYRFCNLYYEKHYRRKREQIIGLTVEELLGPDTYKQVKPVIGRVLSGETVFYEQWVDYREAGNIFVRGSLIPDISSSGEVQGYFAMIQDMTARKHTEDALAKAKEKAEATSASKSRFLAAASHDLRQPMQALAMFVDVLAGRRHDKGSREIIEKIQASSRSLEGLLNSLLDISKLEADLVVPARRRFTVSELMSRLAEEIKPLADRKGLDLVYVPSSLQIMSDPGLLDRILRNLLTNAVAHTESGRILFGCRRRGGELRIEIWDTGPGIPDDQKEHIFEEFYQGGAERGDQRDGLGLGLAIVDRLVKLLEHRIEVSSRVGRGSVFGVRVPIDEAEETEKTEETAMAPVPAQLSDDASGALIVGIDDDPTVRDALSLLLESWGFEAVIAASEQEAVNRLSAGNKPPDLVIADYRLHQGNKGSHAINAIRRRWGNRIPGLLLTGDTDPQGLKEATESGFQVVKKPIMPEKLKARVAEQIQSSHPASKPQSGNGKHRRPRAGAGT